VISPSDLEGDGDRFDVDEGRGPPPAAAAAAAAAAAGDSLIVVVCSNLLPIS